MRGLADVSMIEASRLTIRTTCLVAVSALFIAGAPSPAVIAKAAAAELPTRHVLTLDVARHVAAAAIAEAQSLGRPCVVAVVDASGYLIVLDRMDGSPMLASVDLAPAKARTAAMFAKPSQALEDTIHNGRFAATTSGFVQMSGGVPLTVNGELVGAIGVSSALPDGDVAIANAGAASLSKTP
jgi:glc operon protein GlcG